MNLKAEIKKIANSSTAHGVNHIANRHRKRSRIFWSIFLIVASTSSIYVIALKIINYREYSVVTNIQVVYKKDPEFPKITICYRGNTSNFDLFTCYFNDIACGFYLNKINNECYNFNSGLNNLLKVSEINYRFGLKITFINLDETKDFDVMITNPRKRYLSESKIRVGNSIEKDIRINQEYETKLNEPYSDCMKEVTVKNVTYPYFQSDCLFECEIEKKSSNKSMIVQFLEDRFLANYFHTLKYDKECQQKCPVECDSLIYDVSTSNLIKKDPIWIDFARINIFYESFESQHIIEKPKTSSSDLFSQVGGLLGLFLGISILSLAETIEILLTIFSFIWKCLIKLF